MTRCIPISSSRIHFRPATGFSAQEDMNEHTSHFLSLPSLTSKYNKQALLTKDLLSLLLDPLNSKICLMTINPTNRLNMGHPIFTAGQRQKKKKENTSSRKQEGEKEEKCFMENI